MINEKKPLISVIVPIYKVEDKLSRCLDSILDQSFDNFELLLINDGSPDRCGEICNKYAQVDDRIRVFHKKNGGVSSARNLGLDNALGEWIAFCDSDDWVKKDWLKDFVELGVEHDALLSEGFFALNWKNKEDKTIKLPSIKVNTKSEVFQLMCQLIAQSQLGFLWCKLFRKDVIDAYSIRFNKSYCFMEDLVFITEYCKHINCIKNTSSSQYVYQFTPAGKSFGKQNDLDVIITIITNILQIEHTKEQKAMLVKYYFNSYLYYLRQIHSISNLNKYLDYYFEHFYNICSVNDAKGLINRLVVLLLSAKTRKSTLIIFYLIRNIRFFLTLLKKRNVH